MRARFASLGLRFFALMFALGFVLFLIAPLGEIRLFCLIALCCAAAGLTLNVYALHDANADAFTALRDGAVALMQRLRSTARHAVRMFSGAASRVPRTAR